MEADSKCTACEKGRDGDRAQSFEFTETVWVLLGGRFLGQFPGEECHEVSQKVYASQTSIIIWMQRGWVVSCR